MVFRVDFNRNHNACEYCTQNWAKFMLRSLEKKSIDLGYCCTTINEITVRVCLGNNSSSDAEERQLGIFFGDIFISNVSKI